MFECVHVSVLQWAVLKQKENEEAYIKSSLIKSLRYTTQNITKQNKLYLISTSGTSYSMVLNWPWIIIQVNFVIGL